VLKDRLVSINGDFVAWDQARVHMLSHSFSRGSAIFEVISVHEMADGAAVFRLDEHARRIFRTARLLNMELPLSMQDFQQAVLDTVRENRIRQGYVKVMGYYPQVAFGILPPQKRLDVAIFAFEPARDLGNPSPPVEQGTTLGIASWRKLDPKTVPIEAKVAANYLNGMMARAEAKQRGFAYTVMLDTQGLVAEGGTESIFLVKDSCLIAPKLGHILQSISRLSVLQIAALVGIDTHEGRLERQALYTADEIFLSSTPFKVHPVRLMEDRQLEAVPGPVTQQLLQLVRRIVRGEDRRFKKWLFPIDF
jgi:branched-chain amino acid aminotransferase